MRGEDKKQSSMLVLMSPETRVPQTHPLRTIKRLADEALAKLSPVFDAMYAEGGRPAKCMATRIGEKARALKSPFRGGVSGRAIVTSDIIAGFGSYMIGT